MCHKIKIIQRHHQSDMLSNSFRTTQQLMTHFSMYLSAQTESVLIPVSLAVSCCSCTLWIKKRADGLIVLLCVKTETNKRLWQNVIQSTECLPVTQNKGFSLFCFCLKNTTIVLIYLLGSAVMQPVAKFISILWYFILLKNAYMYLRTTIEDRGFFNFFKIWFFLLL